MLGPWKYAIGTRQVPVCTSTLPAVNSTAAAMKGTTCVKETDNKSAA
jgi:hypothetical protein